MKIFLFKWLDCISNLHVLIVNAKTKKEAEQKFEKWQKETLEEPLVVYSPREYNMEGKNTLYLESWRETLK